MVEFESEYQLEECQKRVGCGGMSEEGGVGWV